MKPETIAPPGTVSGSGLPPQALDVRAGSFLHKASPEGKSLWLPPKEYCNPPEEPYDTPVDERGIVDESKLIQLVKSTVDPAYDWHKLSTTHHFYWPESRYSYDDKWTVGKSTYTAGRFRDLPIHKGELPRDFENWLHIVTRPPAVPEREVMQYRIDAWRVAVNLFRSARDVVLWEKRAERRSRYLRRQPEVIGLDAEDIFAQEYIAEIIDKHFRGVERHMSDLERVPPEFRLIQPSNSPHELATNLGKVVGRSSLKLRRAIVEDKLPVAA